jgi:hypothetical protein
MTDQLTKLYKKHDELKKRYWLADENGLHRERDRYDEALAPIEEEIFATAPTTAKLAVRKLRDVISWSDGASGIDDPVERAIAAIESGVYDVRSVVAALKRLLELAGMVDRETMDDGNPTVPVLRQVITYLSQPKLAARGGRQATFDVVKDIAAA